MSDDWPRDLQALSDDELLHEAIVHRWDHTVIFDRAGFHKATARAERKLRSSEHEETAALDVASATAAARIAQLMTGNGGVLDHEAESGRARVRGLFGAGFAGGNPAVIVATMTDGAGGCELHVRAAAREGLINQHTARKGCAKVIAAARGKS